MARFPRIRKNPYDSARSEIRSGDILLASGNYMFSKLIRKATDSCWSHVAFVMRLDEIDRVMVLESIEGKGVRTLPLSEYVSNFEGSGEGYNGRLAIARHSDFEAKVTAKKMKSLAQFAVDRFAYPYDEEEIARITARIVGAKLGFKPREMKRNEEYICSEYVYECYRKVGIRIRQGNSGFIAPGDFPADSRVRLQFEIVASLP
ncbi:MAG: YiiX/YebB-like N1pC/P60 family cysteine hydrolase [Desulfobulbaceae bacterium]|nr:YiiX/YebB-like N1pC/P60 family cysteine hydrolase [Desulfobulbaceae bacterium]